MNASRQHGQCLVNGKINIEKFIYTKNSKLFKHEEDKVQGLFIFPNIIQILFFAE